MEPAAGLLLNFVVMTIVDPLLKEMTDNKGVRHFASVQTPVQPQKSNKIPIEKS